MEQRKRGGGAALEKEIVALLLQRNEEGLQLLLRYYGPLLRYMIAPILPDPQDREDCLSETTLRVWEGIARFDPQRGSWNAWLTAVARNTALNHARQLSRHSGASELTGEIPAPQPSPEEQLVRKERQTALRRALAQLSDGEQALFYRKYYYLQSTAQIASELGMTERAVEGRLYRVKKRLRRLLGGEADV